MIFISFPMLLKIAAVAMYSVLTHTYRAFIRFGKHYLIVDLKHSGSPSRHAHESGCLHPPTAGRRTPKVRRDRRVQRSGRSAHAHHFVPVLRTPAYPCRPYGRGGHAGEVVRELRRLTRRKDCSPEKSVKRRGANSHLLAVP